MSDPAGQQCAVRLAHTWNLVYLRLAIEELGHDVVNLGACVLDELLVQQCLAIRPDLVVLSGVNGHGVIDGLRVIGHLRDQPPLADVPVVIGGILGTAGPAGRRDRELLLAAGFTAVFDDGNRIPAFRTFLTHVAATVSG